MKKFYVTALGGLCLIACMPLSGKAQYWNHGYRENVSVLNSKNVDTTSLTYGQIVRIIQEQEDRRFLDPKAPRFILIDQENKFGFGIGGFVKITNSYGFDRTIPGSKNYSFIPAQIPVRKLGNGKGRYMFAPQTSELFFKLAGDSRILGEFTVYTSFNFTGSNGSPVLRQAYIAFKNLLVGRTWNTFTDLRAQPPTVDYAGPNAETGFLNTMIRYAPRLSRNWQVAVSVELPQVQSNYGPLNKSVSQAVPDITAYVKYKWNDGVSHFRVAGLFRDLYYRNTVSRKNHSKAAWGISASGVAGLASKLTLYYQYAYGEGIGAYLNDVSNLNLDLVPNPEKPGSMTVLPMSGWYAGLQYTFSPAVFASVTYSQARVYKKNGYTFPNLYKYGQYVVGNVFWNLTADCQLGLEYLYGRRVDKSLNEGKSNRINAMIVYNF